MGAFTPYLGSNTVPDHYAKPPHILRRFLHTRNLILCIRSYVARKPIHDLLAMLIERPGHTSLEELRIRTAEYFQQGSGGTRKTSGQIRIV